MNVTMSSVLSAQRLCCHVSRYYDETLGSIFDVKAHSIFIQFIRIVAPSCAREPFHVILAEHFNFESSRGRVSCIFTPTDAKFCAKLRACAPLAAAGIFCHFAAAIRHASISGRQA